MSTLLDNITEEKTTINVDNGDHDLFSHYSRKEDIMESAMTGAAIIALCGKVWTPGRDPQKFPVCSECKEIFDEMKE